MELADAVRAVFTTMRRRPGDLFPFYILGLAVPAIVRVLTFVGLGGVFAYLVTTGRLTAFREELTALEEPPDPEADPAAFAEWSESLVPVFETVVTPVSVFLLIVTILVSLAFVFVLTAAVTGAQLATCFARLRQERGLVAGITGFRQYWLRMTGLYLLEITLWIVLTLTVAFVIGAAAVVSVVLAVFVGIFAGLAWLLGAVVIRAIFTFAPVALVVGDTSIIGALRRSVGFIRGEFMHAVSYWAIAIGVLLGWAAFSSTLAGIGIPSLAALGSFLLVAPALDLLKTVLYGEFRGKVDPLDSPEVGFIAQTKHGLTRGLRETGGFVRAAPWLHAAAFGTLAIGFITGWMAAEPLVGEFEASIDARIAALFPPTAAVEFFGNNWSVALSTAFSGVAAAIPAITSLWFNGFVFAIFFRLEAAPIELIAFVLPHGIIEIPAILIAGAVGFYLGIATWRTWRGRIGRDGLAEALERSFWVLIGVGVLLAVAGLIEGFVSPYYYQPFV